MFERFTDRCRRVLVHAQEEAALLAHPFIGTEHILLGLIREEDGIAATILDRCGITLDAVRNQVEEIVGASSNAPNGAPPFTPRAKKVLELALRDALERGHSYIGTEHLLLGLIREGQGVGARVIERLGVDLGQLRQEVVTLMSDGAEDRSIQTEGRIIGHADPPRCARCRAGLSGEARYRVIEVPNDDPDTDQGVLNVTVIYCGRCGTTVGTA